MYKRQDPANPKATISSVLTLNGIVPFCEERHGFTKSNSFVEQALIPKRLGSPVGLIVSVTPKCSSCMLDPFSMLNGPWLAKEGRDDPQVKIIVSKNLFTKKWLLI